jgi:hypothetical protein
MKLTLLHRAGIDRTDDEGPGDGDPLLPARQAER